MLPTSGWALQRSGALTLALVAVTVGCGGATAASIGDASTEDGSSTTGCTHVRTLREKRGLSLEEIAHRAEMHWRHWQKVESGEVGITLRTLAKLADVLSVEPGELLR